ncbi:MAG: hypothetical protein FWD42_02300 [Solirubrobacterales bacterium]|nr:hypothetical protein [Solirubrobacterales bacterium]
MVPVTIGALNLSTSTLVALLVAILVVVALIATLNGGNLGKAYDDIGEGGLSLGDGAMPPEPHPESPAARGERELEIRQMLQARSERMVRRGEAPLDIDAELTRLQQEPPPQGAPGAHRHDPSLVEEVRQLVTARNARRVRRGEEPLDVESEVERTLAELDP